MYFHTQSAKINEAELNKSQQQYLQNLIKNQSLNISEFFQNKKKSPNKFTIQSYLNGSISKIDHELKSGQLYISDKSLSAPLKRNKNDNKINQIKQKKQNLQKQLGYLYTQMKSYGVEEDQKNINRNPSLLSKEQHKKLIKNLIKKHQQYEQLHKKNIQQIQKKKKQEEQIRKKQQIQRIQKQKQERRKKIEQNLNQIKQIQMKRKIENQETSNKLEQVKKKKFLHQIMEQKFQNQVVLPSLQEKKKKLKQIRLINKPINIQQIKLHQQQYLKKKQQLKEEGKKKIVNDWKYQAPSKSNRLQKILQEEEKKKKQKAQEKKKLLQEKIQRVESYALYLKQNFKPKIDEQKKLQLEERINKQRQKSLQENQNDTRQIGLQYLQYVRRNNSKLKSRQKQQKNNTYRQNKQPKQATMTSQSKTNSLKPLNYLLVRPKQQYEQIRNKKLQKIINDKDRTKSDRINILKSEAQKINQLVRRKDQLLKLNPNQQNQQQVTQLLLASIKAKMGIIDIYKS